MYSTRKICKRVENVLCYSIWVIKYYIPHLMVLQQCWLAILKQIKDVDLNLQEDNHSQYFIHGDVILMLSTENWSIIIIIPKITLWPSEPTLLHYEWLIVLLSDDRGFRKSFIKYHSQTEELHETRKCTLFSKSKDKVVNYIHQYVAYFVLIRWPIRRHIFFCLIHTAVDKIGLIHHSSAVQNFIC